MSGVHIDGKLFDPRDDDEESDMRAANTIVDNMPHLIHIMGARTLETVLRSLFKVAQHAGKHHQPLIVESTVTTDGPVSAFLFVGVRSIGEVAKEREELGVEERMTGIRADAERAIQERTRDEKDRKERN